MSEPTTSASSSGDRKLFYIFAALTVIAPIVIGYYWLISVAVLVFLLLLLPATVSYLGPSGMIAFLRRMPWVGAIAIIVYVALLVLAPIKGEYVLLKYGNELSEDQQRQANPRKFYVIWAVDASLFTNEKNKKAVKRWNPLLPENKDHEDQMLAAAWMKKLPADVLVAFDSTKVDPEDQFLLIIFESIQVPRIIPPEDPKKDEPTTVMDTKLKITFNTPSAGDSNKYVMILDDLKAGVFDVVSDGLARSLRGEKGLGQDEEEDEKKDDEEEDETEDEDDEKEDDE